MHKLKSFVPVSIILIGMLSGSAIAQDTQGFFLYHQHSKAVSIPPYRNYNPKNEPADEVVTINFNDTVGVVSKYIYGNNANVYMTQMVNQPKLIKYIRLLSPNVLRYPGGNLSNLFFWNEKQGVKPSDVPDTILYGDKRKIRPSRFWYGDNDSPRSLSVDNYYKMLKMTNSTGDICINNGYARYGTGPNPVAAAAHLAADWVRYDQGRTKFWEIGNEDYGPWEAGFVIDTTKNKDGQPRLATGKLYGRHFKVIADSMRAAAREVGAQIYLGAVLEELPKNDNPIMHNWNRGFFEEAGNKADFFIIHSYYTPYNQDSPPDVILNSARNETTKMMDYMKKMCRIFGVEQKPVALTEWNIFAVRSRQACSFINGMHAALVLGSLAENKYGFATRWNLANGYAHGNDHGMFNKGDEPGVPLWNPRPVFFYMYYFQKFFGDHVVKAHVSDDSSIVIYPSTFSNGPAGIVVVNKSSSPKTVWVNLKNFNAGDRYYMYRLTGGDDNAPFSQRVYVNGAAPDNRTGGPIKELTSIKAVSSFVENNSVTINTPGYSVQYIIVDKAKE